MSFDPNQHHQLTPAVSPTADPGWAPTTRQLALAAMVAGASGMILGVLGIVL